MKDGNIAGSKPVVADHKDVAVNDQCMEYQEMTYDMDIYHIPSTYVAVSRAVAYQFAPTGGPKVVLHENENDWMSDDSEPYVRKPYVRNKHPLYGIYISCNKQAQDKKGYRMIMRDCGKAQDYTHVSKMSVEMQKTLRVPYVEEDSWVKVDSDEDLSPCHFQLGCQDFVYIDELYSLAPDMSENIAEHIYGRFELLTKPLVLVFGRDEEYVAANLSVVFCLPPETPTEVIELLCLYFSAE